MTRDQLRAVCVMPGCDVSRFNIFLALNALLQRLCHLKIYCEVWVDGSFVTEKPIPNDIDASIMIDVDIFDALDHEAKQFVLDLTYADSKYEHFVDAHVCLIHPVGTGERELDPPEDYARLWGIGHDERHLKGFIVLEVPYAVQ